MNSRNLLAILILTVLVFSGCKNNNKTDEGKDVEITQKDIENSFDQAKAILYSLPSPVETALVLESAGVEFNSEILNSTEKINEYTTNKKKALNLGVYSADLSYASLFDQQQITINYLAASKKLADQLGILDAIDDATVQKFEENISDKDEIMNIISETFMNSSSYLEENNRGEISALIILGGWIEGLYISVKLAGDNVFENKELVEIILGQQFSLEDMIGLMEFYEDYKEIRLLTAELKELKVIFEKIEDSGDRKNFSLLTQKISDMRAAYTE